MQTDIGGWLRLLLVALPGDFCLPFITIHYTNNLLTCIVRRCDLSVKDGSNLSKINRTIISLFIFGTKKLSEESLTMDR